MAPLIGVGVSLDRGQRWRPGHDYLYVHRAYSQALRAAGAIPVLVSVDTPVDCVKQLAGLVISGGDDLPARWGAPLPMTGAEDVERITHDRALIDAFAAANKPLLGVCYGMQLMNLHFGGTLQNVAEHPTSVDHGGSGRVTEHNTSRQGSSLLINALPQTFTTNSIHRQGISEVAGGFNITATATDGLVEAIERDRLFGVEWHPEMDATGPALYRRFVALCTGP
jgi:putative glutamine amidotransferase